MRVAICLALLLLLPDSADAAGLFLAPRGTRPLGRGGAFVAGADDADALNYNVAGLAGAAPGAVAGLALPLLRIDYVPRSGSGSSGSSSGDVAGTDSRTGTDGPVTTHTSAAHGGAITARGSALPLPSVAVVLVPSQSPWLHVGIGAGTETPALLRWPDAAAGAARYGTVDLAGTALVKLALGAGIAVGGWLQLGAGIQLLAGTLAARHVVSACDGILCTQPENPDYDATVQVSAPFVLAPGLQLGAVVRPWPWLAVGAAWESGYALTQRAQVAARLPAAAAFAGATLDPERPEAEVSLALPAQWRLGAELHVADTRAEVAATFDPWHVHERIAIAPRGARMRHVMGVGDYAMPALDVPRGFVDTYSLRAGVEQHVVHGPLPGLALRAGALYEPAALPHARLSPMAVDLDRIMASLGATLPCGRWQLQLSVAQIWLRAAEAPGGVPQINPTRPRPVALSTLGAGRYAGRATVLAAAVATTW